MKVSIYQKSYNNKMLISINISLGISFSTLYDFMHANGFSEPEEFKVNKFTRVYLIHELLSPQQQEKIKKGLYKIGGANFEKDLSREESIRKYKAKKKEKDSIVLVSEIPHVITGFSGNLIAGDELKFFSKIKAA